MPRARYGPRRRFSRNRTRSLEWSDLVESSLGNVAANTIREVTLQFNTQTSPEVKVTIYRVVGVLAFRAQGDVEAISHYGLYRAIDATQISPLLKAENDNWMWWSSNLAGTAANGNRIINIPFDVKVKRILDTGDELRMSFISNVANSVMFQCRILSKLTGT